MAGDPHQQRKRKRLLVATIGVATVSFLGLQTGCRDEEPVSSGNLLPPGAIDTSNDPTLARDAASSDPLVGTGNLVAPPPVSGNLLPPPTAVDAGPKDAALDALIVSGNLVAPPPQDAAADASDGAAKDAKVDTGIIPPSGNLMPAPDFGTK